MEFSFSDRCRTSSDIIPDRDARSAERRIWRDAFAEILRGAFDRGYAIHPLSRIAADCRCEALPGRPFRTALLPGRAVPCSV